MLFYKTLLKRNVLNEVHSSQLLMSPSLHREKHTGSHVQQPSVCEWAGHYYQCVNNLLGQERENRGNVKRTFKNKFPLLLPEYFLPSNITASFFYFSDLK